MRALVQFTRPIVGTLFILLTSLLFAGCNTGKQSCVKSTDKHTPASAVITTEKPVVNVPPAPKAIRIRAGTSLPFIDSNENAWLPDQGFADGDTIERPDLVIGNTKDQGIYRAERYSMTSFSWPLPNGKYTVKLHFAETYEGITAAGERVFTFNVQGREFKDFDVFAKTGGSQRAYIETVQTEITDGKLKITFTPQVENPEINGIEIIPGW